LSHVGMDAVREETVMMRELVARRRETQTRLRPSIHRPSVLPSRWSRTPQPNVQHSIRVKNTLQPAAFEISAAPVTRLAGAAAYVVT